MGCLRRSIEIGSADGRGWAALEDDFHHFRVWIDHRNGAVTDAVSQSVRTPWTACPLAGTELKKLVGMPLSSDSTAVIEHTDIRYQCTHMFDLAGLAIAAAARGVVRRHYRLEVDDRVGGCTAARIWRDGSLVVEWQVEGTTIVGPAPYEGRSLKAGFVAWAREALSVDEAEAAIVLRRGVFISNGRGINLDVHETAAGMNVGACITFQPARAPQARRIKGSTRDFTPTPDALLADEKTWPDGGPPRPQ